jgi:hypothetical protein
MAFTSSFSNHGVLNSAFEKPARGNAFRRSNDAADLIAWWCTAVRAHS